MYEVFSSGGGTQSACISALIVQGRLPKPDFMVIADTGRECSSTWEYLDTVIRPAMATVGVEVHRLALERWGRRQYQEEFAYGSLLVPAYTTQSGETGKLPGFCSSKWKVDSITRFLLAQGYAGRITESGSGSAWTNGVECSAWRAATNTETG